MLLSTTSMRVDDGMGKMTGSDVSSAVSNPSAVAPTQYPPCGGMGHHLLPLQSHSVMPSEVGDIVMANHDQY